MYWILQLLVNAAVLLLMAKLLNGVKVRSYGTAVIVALVIGLLNATIGWILSGILNLFTLWLLSFIVQLIVSAIMIKLADKLFKGFEVPTFLQAILIAIAMAIASTILSNLLIDQPSH